MHLKLVKLGILAASTILTVACGGSNGEESPESASSSSSSSLVSSSSSSSSSSSEASGETFDGIWYSSITDQYYEIAGNDLSLRSCTISSGYVVTETSTINNSSFLLSTTNQQHLMALDSSGLTLSATNSLGNSVSNLLLRVDSVPATCTNSVIEIVSLSPQTAVQGVETEFTVTIDYRLTATEDTQLRVGSNKNRVDGYTSRLQQGGFTGPDTASFNFSFSETPLMYSSPDTFKLSVIFKTTSGTRLAFARYPITVTPAE